MIDFQSPAIVKNASYRPCLSPSPGGSNERSECHFLCCSGVGRDEGELNFRERGERHLLRAMHRSLRLCASVANIVRVILSYYNLLKTLPPRVGERNLCPSVTKILFAGKAESSLVKASQGL